MHMGRMYAIGEQLPVAQKHMVDAWIAAGTAQWDEVDKIAEVEEAEIEEVETEEVETESAEFESLMELKKDALEDMAYDFDIELPKNATKETIAKAIVTKTLLENEE